MASEQVKALQSDFDDIAEECQRYCYITRDRTFQIEAIEKLSQLRSRLAVGKQVAVASQNDDLANAFLCVDYMAEALSHELAMWIKLKSEDPNGAWDELVGVQDAARWAVQSHEIAGHLESYAKRLHVIEKI